MEAKIQSGEFEMVRRYYICSLRRKNETPFHEIIGTFPLLRENTFFFCLRAEDKESSDILAGFYVKFGPVSRNRKCYCKVD